MSHPALTAPPTMLGSGGGMTNEQVLSVATKAAAGGAVVGAALGVATMPPKLTLQQRFGP